MATDLTSLNEQQRNALLQSLSVNTALIACAGSGKTHTLVKRTQYLIDDLHVDPMNIVMITFTNKAANEVKERIATITPEASHMWIGTFHRTCIKLLRMFGSQLQIPNFTVIDPSETKKILKKIIETNHEGLLDEGVLAKKISTWKNRLIRPTDLLQSPKVNKIEATIYSEYQNQLWKNRTFDFDDLIIYGILLISTCPLAATWVKEHFRYVMVDECQDSNDANMRLIRLLVGDNNLMIVADDDQSIYGFRNAKPGYVLNFKKMYPSGQVLYLTQNYRCTKTIIDAANAVISNNKIRYKKRMTTQNPIGSKISYITVLNDDTQATYVANKINTLVKQGANYQDFGILYRTNAQSGRMETALNFAGIPVKVSGGFNFYSRKEIKDMLAYCKTISNPLDSISFERVLSCGVGVGKKTAEDIIQYALTSKLNYIHGLETYLNTQKVKASIQKELHAISTILNGTYSSLSKIVQDVLATTKYEKTIKEEENMEVLQEFLAILLSIEKENPSWSIAEQLDYLSLLSEMKHNDQADAVNMMTIHSAKGLEFKQVFLLGVHDDLYPHKMSSNTETGIEEERRLFYVAMTRAETDLFLLFPEQTYSPKGFDIINQASRFVREIPSQYLEEFSFY